MKMMEGKQKVQQICDLIKKDTLDPAQKEAARIRQEAHEEAHRIIQKAEAHCREKEEELKKHLAQQRKVFLASLEQASSQALETLRQDIEHQVLSKGLFDLLATPCQDPQVLAKLLDAIVQAIHKEGLGTHLTAIIPKTVSKEAVLAALLPNARQTLEKGGIELGKIGGGVALTVRDRQVTIDISDVAIQDLLLRYLRKEFRQHFFRENTP